MDLSPGAGEGPATGSVPTTLRRFVLAAFLLGVIGAGVELLLVGHTEALAQWIPMLLIFLCLGVLAWHGARRSAASLRVFQATMALFVAGGVLGTALHWRGKMEFKQESDPSLRGAKLFVASMKGESPPALAPGVFIQLAVLGMIYTYRHPALEKSARHGSPQQGERG